jgi:hypothetical protein
MGETGDTANFCGECGTPIRGGKFCTKCGTPSGFHPVVTPEMVAAAAAGAKQTGPDGESPQAVFGPPTASGTFPAVDGTRPFEGPPTASGTFPAFAPPAARAGQWPDVGADRGQRSPAAGRGDRARGRADVVRR